MKDYYKILGLTRDSSADSIKQRFKELAFEYHPDLNDNKNANETFIEIYEAYHILSIPDKKSNYDLLYDKYINKSTSQIHNEEYIKSDIQNIAGSARKDAQQRAKTRYKDFIKDQDCFFSDGIKADGKPLYFNMHKNIGISGGTGPMGSIKSRTVSIPIPRSKKAAKFHRIGFLIKVLFLIILIVFWTYNIIPVTGIINIILTSTGILLLGGTTTYLIYFISKTKSKFFQASRYFLVKKYKKKGYNRGFHPMISTTPFGIVAYILRWIF
ncbi:MAG TPA: DnaJ domain-containing protein [Bacteroidales bacterium]|nr:DnaJ domain-containing protein [Bacteroidales bacterium]